MPWSLPPLAALLSLAASTLGDRLAEFQHTGAIALSHRGD
jgi:hypothetical protein